MHMLIVAFVLTGAGLASAQEPMPAAAQPAVIVTTGDATVRRPPDRAFVTIAVESRSKNPRDAQKQTTEAMTAIQGRLGQARLGAQDSIRTVGYDLEQEFEVTPNGRVPREFVARNTIEVRIDDLGRIGDVIDSVVRGGATSVAGVRFELQNRAAAEQEALKLAVTDARGRAEAAATGAGLIIDRVIRIEDRREGLAGPTRPVVMAARTLDASTPVEPGLIEIRAHVILTVAIK
jgi:uncharacterized protein YggE